MFQEEKGGAEGVEARNSHLQGTRSCSTGQAALLGAAGGRLDKASAQTDPGVATPEAMFPKKGARWGL